MDDVNIIEFPSFLDKNKFYKPSDLKDKYMYGVGIYDQTLFIKDIKLFNKYSSDNLINYNNKSISIYLLRDLLNDLGLYYYLSNNIKNKTNYAVQISCIIDDISYGTILLTVAELMNFYKVLAPELSALEQLRIRELYNLVSFNKCIDYYKESIYSTSIDHENISIEVSKLLLLISSKEKEYNRFLISDEYYGLDTKIIAYLIVSFFERKRILQEYVCDDYIIERINDLKKYKDIDYQNINKENNPNDYLEDGTSLINLIHLNDELLYELDKYINNKYSDLEKAIYYFKELEYLLIIDNSKVIDNLEDELIYINSVNKDNYDVNINEFILIYTKILKNLNIKYSLNGNINNNLDLSFKSGEYLLSLKINNGLLSIECDNQNEVTKRKYIDILNKVIKEREIRNIELINFDLALERYKNTYIVKEVSLKDKLFILFKNLSRKELKGIDNIEYQMKIFNNIFKEEIKSNLIKIDFLSQRVQLENNTYTPATVVTISAGDSYEFYLIDQNKEDGIEKISEEELLKRFETGEFAYLDIKQDKNEFTLTGGKHVR